ncbi:MAG: hypothetical protein LBQ95_08015 [Lachnospiraceae bacterium]|nr:hypothetical protein [Lachnospiraceae bacterium]
MKKAISVILAVILCATLFAACQKKETPVADVPGDSDGVSGENATAANDDSWNDMTDEELYELAKAEGGEINVYTISSRMQTTCDSFNEVYPGLNAVATNLDQTEATAKIRTEAESGNITADVLQCKDGAGEIYYDFYPLGYLETFYPSDICSHISPELLKYGMPFYTGLNFWYYNTDQYPDGAPVDNWWQIIEKDDAGNNKFNIICANVGSDDTYITFYANVILNADKFAEAYEELYGEPIEYTYDASKLPNIPENNAGYEFLYRLSQCKLTFISDGDDICDAVQGSSVPTLGLSSAGKITNRDDNGWPIAWVTKLAPFPNMMNTNYLYVVKGTDNPAGARLFIRYLMGGADGTGDGFKPFTKEGNWSIRDDVTNEKNPFDLAESGAVSGDMEQIHEIFLDVKDFWDYWLGTSPYTK